MSANTINPCNVATSDSGWLGFKTAVDASEFQPDPGKRPSGVVTVVALSRLVYRKGIDLLNVVIPAMCDRHPNLRFIIGRAAAHQDPRRQAHHRMPCGFGSVVSTHVKLDI